MFTNVAYDDNQNLYLRILTTNYISTEICRVSYSAQHYKIIDNKNKISGTITQFTAILDRTVKPLIYPFLKLSSVGVLNDQSQTPQISR